MLDRNMKNLLGNTVIVLDTCKELEKLHLIEDVKEPEKLMDMSDTIISIANDCTESEDLDVKRYATLMLCSKYTV